MLRTLPAMVFRQSRICSVLYPLQPHLVAVVAADDRLFSSMDSALLASVKKPPCLSSIHLGLSKYMARPASIRREREDADRPCYRDHKMEMLPPLRARFARGRQVYEALLQYKAEHGNLNVPVAFCVPSSPPWHQDLWGLALGQRWVLAFFSSVYRFLCVECLRSHIRIFLSLSLNSWCWI